MALEEGCTCGTGFPNTGQPECIKHFEITTMLFVVPLFANDGTRNVLNMNSPINILAKTQEIDPSKRWYPITGLLDVKLPTADARYKSYLNGTRKFLQNGIKTFEGVIPESNSMYAGKLQGVNCQKYGVVLGDLNGNVRGQKSGFEFRPILIGAWSSIFMDKVDDDVATTKIMFDFNILLNIQNYWILSKEDIGYNPNDLQGIVDANLDIVNINTTSMDVQTSTDYGSGLLTEGILGQTHDDFSVTKANGSAVTFTVVEGDNGLYSFVFTVLSSDVITVKLLPTSGYEGSDTSPVS